MTNKPVNIPQGQAWQGSGFPYGAQICADVPGIGFRSFPDKDSAVNTLYMAGHKVLARAINKAF